MLCYVVMLCYAVCSGVTEQSACYAPPGSRLGQYSGSAEHTMRCSKKAGARARSGARHGALGTCSEFDQVSIVLVLHAPAGC